MICRSILGILAASLLSCASPATLYERRDDDAVPVYRTLIARFPKLPARIEQAYDRKAVSPAELDAAVAPFEPLLAEISRAAGARRCVWTYDTPPTIAGEYPIDYALTVMRLFIVRSRRRLETGNARGSLEDLLVLHRFGSDLLQDRWTMGKLQGLVVGTIAGFELQDRVARGRLDRAELALAADHLSRILQRFPPSEAYLRDERIMAVPLLEEIRDLGLGEVLRRVVKDSSEPTENPPIVAQWHEWLRSTLRKDMDLAKRRISARWDNLIVPLEEAYRKPLNSGELSRRMEELKDASSALSDRFARRMLGLSPAGDDGFDDIADLLFRLWVPALERMAANHAKVRVLLETTLLACVLDLHRLSSGSYPERPGDAGEVPKDPFGGGRLRYQRIVRPEGEGYVLAAAGPNDDAQERIRAYSEEYRFDGDAYGRSRYGDSDSYTFGVFRGR